jgi:hypothetical protein
LHKISIEIIKRLKVSIHLLNYTQLLIFTLIKSYQINRILNFQINKYL